MAIDASIALQGKLPQIQSPNELMTNAYAMQNARQANELNMLKMNEYKSGLAEQEQFKNALSQAKDDAGIKNAFYSLGEKGIKGYQDYLKGIAEQAKLGAETTNLGYTGQKTQVESAAKKQDMLQSMARDLSTRPSDANIMAHAEDIAASPLFTPEEKAAVKRRAQDLLSKPMDQRVPDLASSGASASDLKPHFVNQENVMINGVPTSRVVQMPAFGGQASTVAGSTGATYNKPAASVNVNTNLPAQEKEFEKQLGTEQAKKVVSDKVKAEDAAQILATNNVAKSLLDKGMITGTGADFFVGFNKALNKAGIDFGYADAAANSQAYGGLMATNTAKLIKNFGAGTGLSDADRAYALKAAAGDINMDEKAIRRLIDINNKAAQNAINMHNKNVSSIKTNIPLSVNPADYSAGIPEGRGTTSAKRGQQSLDDIFKSR
jgi:hypothetical protein